MTATLPEDRSDEPVTVDRLAADLRDLGLAAGDTVLVHSSLSELGWVCGGPVAVVDALQQVVTDDGTLAMPAHTGDYSDPGNWQHPPVPDEWEETIRETMPAYRPAVTPCRRLGAVPDTFRSYPGVVRSRHPVVSFAAWGAEAAAVTADHSYDEPLGEASPLARLYERDARACCSSASATARTPRSTSPSTEATTRKRWSPTAHRCSGTASASGWSSRTSTSTPATSRRWARRSSANGPGR